MKNVKGYSKVGKRYRAQHFKHGKTYHIGVYDTASEAHDAYMDYRLMNPVGKPGIKKGNDLPTGVTYSGDKSRYIAAIKIDNRNIHLGTYDTVDEALKARKKGERGKRQWKNMRLIKAVLTEWQYNELIRLLNDVFEHQTSQVGWLTKRCKALNDTPKNLISKG